jgi:hypothetical protein
MENERPTQLSTALVAAGVVLAAGAAIWQAPSANWELALLATLLAFSIVSEIMSVETESHLKISGNYLAMIPAMVFLGGTPAALIGLISILVGWIRYRDNLHDLLVNVGTFITFPLVIGVAFQEVVANAGITETDIAFYVLVFGAFVAGIAMNFLMIGADAYYVYRTSFLQNLRTVLIPLLPSELAAGVLAVGVTFIYAQIGLAGVALF